LRYRTKQFESYRAHDIKHKLEHESLSFDVGYVAGSATFSLGGRLTL
jgi:hypothetical protein